MDVIEVSEDKIKFLMTQANTHIIDLVFENPKMAWLKFCEDFIYIEASGGLVKRMHEYLFIFRNEKWDLPKGKLEFKEKPESGAIREIEEECGIFNLEVIRKLTDTFHVYKMNGKSYLKKTYWFLMNYSEAFDGKPQIEEGIKEIKWFRKDAFDSVKNNTYLSILEVIKSAQI
jgi:8-oxo-dGTP pyrophosphatase MutT (NUDIX family)